MTNFEIAKNFTGLTAVALAQRLGVSPQQLNGWLNGSRVPSRTSVDRLAATIDVDPAWLLGVGQQLAVMDPQTGDIYACGIVRTESIPGYGALYHVYMDETGDIIPVILAGGAQLTPADWQTLTIRSAADIPTVSWRDARNVDAVMLDDLPRVLG